MPLKARELKGATPSAGWRSPGSRAPRGVDPSPPSGRHELPQHLVDSCLIPTALALEPRKYVRVEPDADRLLDRSVELPDHSITPVLDLRDIGGVDVLVAFLGKGGEFGVKILVTILHMLSSHGQ